MHFWIGAVDARGLLPSFQGVSGSSDLQERFCILQEPSRSQDGVKERGSKALIRMEKTTKDLGVQVTMGGKRFSDVQTSRLAKAKARSAKTGSLAKTCRKVAQIASTGAYPVATYGTSALGLPTTQRKQLRASMVAACGVADREKCNTTILRICLGPGKDPDIRVPQQQVKDWI